MKPGSKFLMRFGLIVLMVVLGGCTSLVPSAGGLQTPAAVNTPTSEGVDSGVVGTIVGPTPIVGTSLPPSSGSTGEPTQPLPTEVATAAGSSLIVTQANQGQTITMHVGDRFLLSLGDIYNWSPVIADESIISRVVNITVVRGSQGVYEAHKAGQTTLTAVGDPLCRTSKPPCMMPSINFQVNIVVQ